MNTPIYDAYGEDENIKAVGCRIPGCGPLSSMGG